MEIGIHTTTTIAIEAVLLGLSILLAGYSLSDKKRYPDTTPTFLLLLVGFLVIEMAIDLACYILDTVSYDATIKYVLHQIIYVFSNLIPWSFARGVIHRSGETRKIVARICDAVVIAANVIVVFGAPFNLVIASVSAQSVTAGPLYPVLFICPAIHVIIAIIWSFKIHSFPYLWRFSIIFLGVASLAAACLASVFPGIPMTIIAQTFGVTGLVLTSRSSVIADSSIKAIELATAKAELSDEKNATLVSQIKPHFVQNSLMAIAYLCEEDPKAAKALTLDFARYLRGNIDSINGADLIPFTKELEHTKTYLAIERARFGNRFEVVYDIEEDDFLVPPLSIQPLVENALKHGISPLPEGGTIWISTQKLGENYRITIRDNGIGFDPEAEPDDAKSHVGVANTRNRFNRLLGGVLNVKTSSNVGTEVAIEFPVSAAEKESQ